MVHNRDFQRLRRLFPVKCNVDIFVRAILFIQLPEEDFVLIPCDIAVGGFVIPDADDLPVLKLHHGVAIVIHKVCLVGNQQNQMFLRHLLEDIHDENCICLIEIAGRLVRQDNLGVLHNRPGDGNALLLTAGEGVRKALCEHLHTVIAKGSLHSCFDGLLIAHAAQAECIRHVFIHGLIAI